VTTAVGVLWLAWLLFWLLAARHVKPARWREPLPSLLAHMAPLTLAALLLLLPGRLPAMLTKRFLPAAAPAVAIAGIAVLALGLGLAAWARVYLGGNWSGRVTLKQDHALITGGPYRRVRHPIYSGLLLAFAGTAIVFGEWRGLLALALAFAAFLYKSRVEERRLQAVFPEYDSYRRRTAALIPFML
jgi:protein-S-isoprenylcysteine O-methyltransferase Ste14